MRLRSVRGNMFLNAENVFVQDRLVSRNNRTI
jgi:hypothetical protein